MRFVIDHPAVRPQEVGVTCTPFSPNPDITAQGSAYRLGSYDHELDYILAGRPWAVLSLGLLICKVGVLTPQLVGLS